MKIFKTITKFKYADIVIIGSGIILAYGLLIPFLHFYIDDWYWTWSWNTYGHEGIAAFYNKIRPSLGIIFQQTIPILSIKPIYAHLFSLFMRLSATLLFYLLLITIWPAKKKEVLFSTLIFGVYPGFALQSIAMTYSHIFLILSTFLLSLYGTILWIKSGKIVHLIYSLILSFINLFMLEYFYTLEMLRFILIFILFSREETNFFNNIKKSIQYFLPYIFIFAITSIIRITVIPEVQTNHYDINFLQEIKTNPLSTLWGLLVEIIKDLYVTTIGAWAPAIEKLSEIQLNRTNLITIFISLLFSLIVVFYLISMKSTAEKKFSTTRKEMLAMGFFAFFFAGWPFWITRIDVSPFYLSSRFTLSFLIATAILFALLYSFLSHNKVVSSIVVIIAIFPSMVYQILTMNDFRIETMQNREMMWEIHWRIPDLEEDTLVLVTDYPNKYYDVATLATELSVLYPKESENIKLPYFMLYSRNLNENTSDGLQKEIPIHMDNVSADYYGSTSQMIAIDYDPGKCVRVLDPELDGTDTNLHEHVQKAAQISDLSPIDLNHQSDGSEMYYFNTEPVNSWCYYFEKADLAKQKKDWQEVVRLYEQALDEGYSFKSERERYPFIEAYAQLGQWDQAFELIEASDRNELAHGLCMLAARIESTTPDSEAKSQFLTDVNGILNCQ